MIANMRGNGSTGSLKNRQGTVRAIPSPIAELVVSRPRQGYRWARERGKEGKRGAQYLAPSHLEDKVEDVRLGDLMRRFGCPSLVAEFRACGDDDSQVVERLRAFAGRFGPLGTAELAINVEDPTVRRPGEREYLDDWTRELVLLDEAMRALRTFRLAKSSRTSPKRRVGEELQGLVHSGKEAWKRTASGLVPPHADQVVVRGSSRSRATLMLLGHEQRAAFERALPTRRRTDPLLVGIETLINWRLRETTRLAVEQGPQWLRFRQECASLLGAIWFEFAWLVCTDKLHGCEFCGVLFQRSSAKRRTCSGACRQALSARRQRRSRGH